MEDDLSDAIYGDLGDFEFNEKLKEQCQKIEDLTKQLNQSILTVTDLQNQMKDLQTDHVQLKKNYSSLLLTARVEIKRKDLNINQLKQQIDNKVFRRRNTFTTGIQPDTHATVDPSYSNCNANMNFENISNQSQHQPVGDLSQFRIPKKKNPFVRHENDLNHIASNGIENGYEHDDPKRNPHARRHDLEDEKHKKQNHGEKDGFQDRRTDNITAYHGIANEQVYDEPRHHIPRHDIEDEASKKQTHDNKDGCKDRRADDITACNGIENEHEHDEARHHLPKRNPHGRRYDAENQKYRKQTREEKDKSNERRDELKRQTHEDKDRFKDRRDKFRDDRKRSPAKHISRGHRDHKKVHASSKDHKRDSSRNNRKRSRGRSSSDEMDRHPKRRSESTTSRHRSKSRPSRIEEKVTSSPRKDKKKHGNRTSEVPSRKDSVDSLKERDLEAMLMAQKKILNEIDGADGGQPPVQNEKSSKKHRKRKSSHTGDATIKMAHEEGSKDLNTANDGNVELNRANDARIDVIAESENTVELLPVDIAVNPKTSDVVNTSPQEIEALPAVSENFNQDLPLMEVATSTNNRNIISPIKEVETPSSKSMDNKVAGGDVPKDASKSAHRKPNRQDVPKSPTSESIIEKDNEHDVPKQVSRSTSQKSMDRISNEEDCSKKVSTSTPSESISEKDVEEDVTKEVLSPTSPESIKEKACEGDVVRMVSESQLLPNDENSNMDIDYELMERTPVENQTSLPCKETDHKMLVESQQKMMSTTENNDATCNETNDESFMSMKVAVNCLSESTLNSSQERHTLSKSKEYTVEDAGYEIRIFLTKKRKKNRNAKVTT